MPLRALIVVGAAAVCAACTSSGGQDARPSSGAPSSVPGSSASTDYSTLLITTSDIPIPGLEAKTAPTKPDFPGAAARFADPSGTTIVVDVISVFGSKDDAGIALKSAEDFAPGQVSGPQTRALPGDVGEVVTGTQGGQQLAIAVFTQGRAFVTVRVQADSVSSGTVDAIVAAQLTRLRNGLH
ncbi:MAG: hypothetical protein ACTHMS_02245 [Jatrophihabitans sp.]|uniref:hypothetical protein n=1 Tax=Jatrophihabitans sp. TaxID=1932789 RepID=UPI003F7D90C7